MNKQEAIKDIEKMGEYEHFVDEAISKKSVLNIIKQIDEPQKAVVPKFVAEWIEDCKVTCNIYGMFIYINSSPSIIREWLIVNGDDGRYDDEKLDVLAHAWLDGYEIEKDKLYTVEIPNSNEEEFKTVLSKNFDGKLFVDRTANNSWRKHKPFRLTESEIKQDFQWAWDCGFAKEVKDE